MENERYGGDWISSFYEYVKNVTAWNQELKQFLESENVDENDELMRRLNGLTSIMNEAADKNLSDVELQRIQSEVEGMMK